MTIDKIPFFDPLTFGKASIGFDEVFSRLKENVDSFSKIPTYPPYNIKKIDDNKYVIEMAVAGFGQSDLEIELEDNTLTVNGSVSNEAAEYLFKGIAERPFTRKFTLADSVKVQNADLINGMLKIWLERLVQEEKKTKININGSNGASSKEFLREDK